MFGSIGSLEILLIVVVALLVVGPKKLPQAARTLGKVFGEFKRVSSDVQRTISAEVDRVERDERTQKAKRELMPEKAKAKEKAAAEESDGDQGKVVTAAQDTDAETAADTAEAAPADDSSSTDNTVQPAKGA